MDEENRAYALSQMGHSIASLFADLIGFSASKVPSTPIYWDIDRSMV